MLENFKNRLLAHFLERALPVSTVTDGRMKRFSYLKAVGTKELERILDEEFIKLQEIQEAQQLKDIPDDELRKGTPLGTLKAYPSTDPAHPGIYIDLILPETGAEIPLVLVEYCGASDQDTDLPEKESVITRVWGDSMQEDYTDRIVHCIPEEKGEKDNESDNQANH